MSVFCSLLFGFKYNTSLVPAHILWKETMTKIHQKSQNRHIKHVSPSLSWGRCWYHDVIFYSLEERNVTIQTPSTLSSYFVKCPKKSRRPIFSWRSSYLIVYSHFANSLGQTLIFGMMFYLVTEKCFKCT